VSLATARLRSPIHGKPVLALPDNDKDLAQVVWEAPAALCVCVPIDTPEPWVWCAAYGTGCGAELLPLDPVVAVATAQLIERMPQSAPLLDLDKKMADETLLLLYGAGYSFKPHDLAAHAAARGWRFDAALDLRTRAEVVLRGTLRMPRGGPQRWAPETLERWVAAAADNAPAA